MSFDFGINSQIKLNTCHEDLRKLAAIALEKSQVDFSIICGMRNKQEQIELFNKGLSQLKFPASKHNATPSNAFDFAPYVGGSLIFPIRDSANYIQEMGYYYYIAGVMQAVAKESKLKIRWGGNWDGDGDFNDQKFHDLGHIEL